MTARLIFWLMLGMMLFSSNQSGAFAEAIRPVEEVRALIRVQDGLGQGKTGSVALQRVLVSQISQQFRRALPVVWSERRSVISAIKYLMSGGDPTFSEGDAFASGVPEDLKPLFVASLAYAKGQVEEAALRFAMIDPREVDPTLGGHVALIKSLVVAAKDQAASMRFLDDARLLGIGTLVEEAALRRQIGVLVHQKALMSFRRLSMRYVRRFQKSIFAPAFREHLATGLTHPKFELDEGGRVWLAALFDRLDRSVRPAYGMVVAKRALVLGRAELVQLATSRVRDDVGRSSDIGARAHLFHAAISVMGNDHAEALEVLRELTNFSQDSFEGRLQQAAIAIADGIASPTGARLNAAGVRTETDASRQSGAPVSDAFSSTRIAAMAAIREADRHLAN